MAADIESALYAFLEATSAVTALVSDRIYPMRAPEAAGLPVLVYHKVNDQSVHSKDGDMNLSSPHFQITAWAAKYADAKAVIAAVRVALNAYTGPSFQGIPVPTSGIDVMNEQDLNDPGSLEYGASLDAIIWHS